MQMPKTHAETKARRYNGTSIHASFFLLFVIAIPLLFIACPRNDPRPDKNIGVSMGTPTQTVTPFPGAVAFNGERAMEHVRKQLDFGPRPPGSPELAKTRDYIINELKTSGLSVSTDEFTSSTPVGERRMANIPWPNSPREFQHGSEGWRTCPASASRRASPLRRRSRSRGP